MAVSSPSSSDENTIGWRVPRHILPKVEPLAVRGTCIKADRCSFFNERARLPRKLVISGTTTTSPRSMIPPHELSSIPISDARRAASGDKPWQAASSSVPSTSRSKRMRTTAFGYCASILSAAFSIPRTNSALFIESSACHHCQWALFYSPGQRFLWLVCMFLPILDHVHMLVDVAPMEADQGIYRVRVFPARKRRAAKGSLLPGRHPALPEFLRR